MDKNKKAISTVPFEKGKISILDISKNRTDTNKQADEFNSLCDRWTLDKKAIMEIIKYSSPISMHDFMYLYNILACEVKGTLKIGEKEYKYTINAGSFMKLTTRDTTYYYGCPSKDCEQYFLSTGGDPSRDLGE